MAEKAERHEVTFTAPVPMAFPNLVEPKAFAGKNGKPSDDKAKFSVNWVFDPSHPDLPELKKLAVAAARSKWPTRALSELAFPFQNGTNIADKSKANGKNREMYRGKVIVASRSKYRPAIGVIENGRIVDLESDEAVASRRAKFFSGAEALGRVCFVPYEGVGQNPDGVTCYIQQVLVTGKGTKVEGMGGGASAAEVFKGYVGSYSQESVADRGVDDEIPF